MPFLKNFHRYSSIFCLLLFFSPIHIHTQIKYDTNFYGGLFYLSDFISSKQWDSLKNKYSDIQLVDTIYFRAVNFFKGDISEALLSLTFACLPYNHVTIRIPIIELKIRFPLPSTPQKIFLQKVKNLPKYLFFDTPGNKFGDKDKLAHFFGNAFIRYNLGFFNLSKFMGIFVEIVEEGLFVEGGFSRKDLVANQLGELFGETLKDNKNVLPSDVIKIYQLLFFRY